MRALKKARSKTEQKGKREMKSRSCLRRITAVILAAALITVLSPVETEAGPGAMGVKGTWTPTPVEGVLSYVTTDGKFLADGYTADGYYVNKNGFWMPAYNILGAMVPARNSWLTAADVGDFEMLIPIMKSAQKKLTDDLHGWRVISVFSSHMTLSSVVSNEKERTKTTRLSIYKNPDFNGYTIEVRTPLAGDEKEMTDDAGEWSSMALYDYQVLRLWMYCISRSGDKVAQAIYSSWMDNNANGLRVGEWVTVGDTLVKYVPSNGAGLYEIRAVF